ncbi:hypothetical protein [Mycolicibacterium septicum]|nr:hypothetical protein [Mycolicibacterium septicum]QRY51746.1 hypothetical protein JVX95_30970 [Mycolicibacterium septicum]
MTDKEREATKGMPPIVAVAFLATREADRQKRWGDAVKRGIELHDEVFK